jgi:hypothetical protein
MHERAHVGSASWITAPDYLTDFSNGSFQDYAENTIEQVDRGEGRKYGMNPAQVRD